MAYGFGRRAATDAVKPWQTPALEGATGSFSTTRRQSPPAMTLKAVAPQANWTLPHHGGPREEGARMPVGAIATVGTKVPLPQCGQRIHSDRSMRRMNAATDSTTPGSGAGTESAARACASFTALPAGPSSP